MASIKKLSSGTFQLTVRNKLLPKPFYATFNSEGEAEAYGNTMEGPLKAGIVPASLLSSAPKQTSWMVSRCIAEYIGAGGVKLSEEKILDTLRPQMVTVSTTEINYEWAEAWVNKLKRVNNLSPSTINKRVGALRRCLDWVVRKHKEIMVTNPLKELKRGFATYNEVDAQILKAVGKDIKESVWRDRRLHEEEEVLLFEALKVIPDESAFVSLAVESAMRMREMYTLDITQISFPKKTINLKKTKNGSQRQVPMSSVATRVLKEYIAKNLAIIEGRGGILFPYWNGNLDEQNLDETTSATSAVFGRIFDQIGMEDFHFHDFRHEATCRLFLRTKLSDIQIAKITGHKDLRMLLRYASLRGSDLAALMW